MIAEFKIDYREMDDRQIVEMVTNPENPGHPNEEAVAFLLYDRYHPLLRKIYRDTYGEIPLDLYGDCLEDLFQYLRGGNPPWSRLASFEWRSAFGTWLNTTARRQFKDSKPRLIGRLPISPLYHGDDGNNCPKPQFPDNGVEDYERRERKVLLLEAIALLDDDDQRFVVLKKLQGYDSKETAILLQKRWDKHGIVKLNNKGERVTPTAGYVDVRMQRAKENLRGIIVKLM